MQEIETFIFFDIETTGLRGIIEITELAMLAISRATLLDADNKNGLPRMLQKLLIQLKPSRSIEPEAAQITGMFN